MSKFLVALALVVTSFTAFADGAYTYVSPTIDFKDKVDSTANHEVYGINLGRDFGNSWKVEARMENERVNGGSHEGLMQVKLNKDIGTWYGVTPYAGVAVGMKDKSTSDFFYYVAEVGAKYTVLPGLTAYAQERLRTPFNENLDGHTGYGYKTWETQIGAKYAITPEHAVGVKYAMERGDSTYDTVGVNYTYSFK
jgi:hypothetical protein